MTERDQEGYELFRRAIVERDSEAWAAIYTRYRPLLLTWAARCNVRTARGEAASDIADQALARAWAALTPERFAAFPTLKQLLGYLRACVATAAIDSARAQALSDHVVLQLHASTAASPEQIALADLDRVALWQVVLGLAVTPAERVALVETFAYGLPPRAIQARHPHIFPDVAAVYTTKRNLFDRLRRNHELLLLREEAVS
jgi:hypothetical protein